MSNGRPGIVVAHRCLNLFLRSHGNVGVARDPLRSVFMPSPLIEVFDLDQGTMSAARRLRLSRLIWIDGT